MHGRERGFTLFGLALSALVALTTLGRSVSVEAQTAAGKVVLFTSEEAGRLRLAKGEPVPGMMRAVSNGPRIVIESPSLLKSVSPPSMAMTSPGNLTVRFEENGVPVDMGSLEVSAKKAFFRKSLTDLLRPYVQGTSLQVKDVEVPAGNFLIEIFVADTQGGETIASYQLEVRDK